jgi:hypothetical protein
MRNLRRYITKAEKIVLNVANSEFPGTIEGFFGTINHPHLLNSYLDLDVALTVQEPPAIMAKVIDKPTAIKRPIKRPIKTPDEYNDLVILQRIVVNANRIGDLEYAEMAQARECCPPSMRHMAVMVPRPI